MKIRYDIDNFLVNGYFDDEKCDYSNNQDYQEMIKNDNFTEILNKDFIRFEFAKVVINKKIKTYTQIAQKEYNLIQQESTPIAERIQNKKNQLISIRKNYLNSTDYKIIKAVESGLEINIELKNQRQKARDELNEIENATSLEQLSKFE